MVAVRFSGANRDARLVPRQLFRLVRYRQRPGERPILFYLQKNMSDVRGVGVLEFTTSCRSGGTLANWTEAVL